MHLQEFWDWLLFRADRIDQALLGLIVLGLGIAFVAAIMPARKPPQSLFDQD